MVLKLPSASWFKARTYHLVAPLVALALVAVFQQTWVGKLLEMQTVNIRFQLRSAFDPPADPRLIFVGIDQQSLDLLGRYPWPRTEIAKFLNALAAENPHTVTFDILYTEKSANPADDLALGQALANVPTITGALSIYRPNGDPVSIAAARTATENALKDPGPTQPIPDIHGDVMHLLGSDTATLPIDPVRKESLFGFANDDPSTVDYIRHEVPLVMRIGKEVYPSLSLQTLCQMLNVDADKVTVDIGHNIVLRNSSGKTWTIPIDGEGKYTINYRSNRSFKNTLSFGLLNQELLAHANQGTPLADAIDLKQKTLVIGETATSLVDLGPTPIDAQSPLPYVHLNVINNVLNNDYLTVVPWPWVVAGWLLVSWVTLLRLKDAPLVESVFVPLNLMIVYIAVVIVVFWQWSIQLDAAWPLISYGVINFWGVVLRWREEQHGRELIKQVFSKMLSPEVMDHLLEHPEHTAMGGSERPVTILFSDIRDYTKFSEGLAPTEVVRQLNIYFERMVPCVQDNEGTLHKYIGDAIMAAWGDIADASHGAEKDARNAVRAALMMRRRLRELNEERQTEGLMPLRIGVGLNHGADVLVGLIGASSRSEFTVMGDAVNTASRLEGLTKEFHTDLAVSESVRNLLGDGFLVRRLGLIVLKGKSKPTVVYEVLAEKTEPEQSKLAPGTITLYETAFDDFLARRFTQAQTGFAACEKEYPNDYCVQEYLKASREFIAQPPPPDWDGRIVMKTK